MKSAVLFRCAAAVAGLVAGLASTPALHAEDSSSVQAKWDAITRCAPLTDDGVRHTCLDEVLRKAGLMTDAARAAVKRQQFGLAAPAAPFAAPARAVAPKPAPPARTAAVAAAAAPVASPKHASEDLIQVTLAGVKHAGDGALLMSTSEGAVWRQIEPVAVHPEPVAGDTLTIKHTAFGGYMCQSKKWIVFRCNRTR